MAGNPEFDALLSTTLSNYRDTLEDHISRDVGVWSYLKRKDRIDTKQGGHNFVIQLMYGKNTTSGTVDMYETLDTTPQDGITAAVYDWKQHVVTVSIAGLEEAMNSGEEQVIDLLKAKVQQAEISASDDFAIMLVRDGLGNSGKDFLGLSALVGDHLSSVTSVGGINCATAGNEFWRSVVERTAEQLTLARMGTVYRQASRGATKPDGAFSGGTLWDKHISLLQPMQRISDSETAQAGFENIMFRGAPHVYDDELEATEPDALYFLNSKYLGLAKLKDVWFKNEPFVTPYNGDFKVSKILTYGNAWVSNRRLGGAKLENKTAA